MKIIVPAFTLLSLLALPLTAQAQGTTAKDTVQTKQRPSRGDPVQGTAKGGTQGSDSTTTNPGVGGADDATANAARTNSPAARSGAVDGRNALSPGEGATGPSGAPAVGTPH